PPLPCSTLFPYTTLFRSFPVELENDQSTSGDLRFPVKLVDLLSMQQKFARALGRRNFVARLCIWLNIGVIKKGFAIFNSRKSIRSEEHTSELQSRFDLVC